VDDDLLQTMRKECEQIFSHTLQGLSSVPMLRPLGNVQFQCAKQDVFLAKISVLPHSNDPKITITEGVYVQLFDVINSNRQFLFEAIFPAEMGVETESLDTLDTVFDLAFNFILQHELNHLFCGHFDYLRNTKGLALDEFSMSESLGLLAGESDDEWVKAYYLEVEADGTAIEWMLERLVFGQLGRDFSQLLGDRAPDNCAITDLPESCRDIGFRYLLTAVWIVITLMESNRSESAKEHSATHPLPAARMITAINLLMLYYADINDFRMPDTGEMFVSATENERKSMVAFISNVLRPVVRGFISLEATHSHSDLVIPYGGANPAEDIALLLIDMLSMFKNETPDSAVMEQVAKIEGVRHELLTLINEYRFMEDMKQDD